MIQYVIVFIVVAIALGYVVVHLYKSFTRKKKGCEGCTGCDLHNKIEQAKTIKHSKSSCSIKKWSENFVESDKKYTFALT